jgi:hypothetical protein
MGSSPDAFDKILPSHHRRRAIDQLAENLRFQRRELQFLDNPLVVLSNEALEVVAIEKKQLHVCRAPRHAEYLNIDPTEFSGAGYAMRLYCCGVTGGCDVYGYWLTRTRSISCWRAATRSSAPTTARAGLLWGKQWSQCDALRALFPIAP